MVSISGCDMFGTGTLGTFQQWSFPVSEKRLDREMGLLYENNPTYVIPDKWKHLDDWQKSGYGFLKGKILFFEEAPEEMYYVSYFEAEPNSFANDNDFTITVIAVRAVNNGNSRWNTVDDYAKNKAEIERIDTRFYKEIISKLEREMRLKVEKRNE